MKKKLTSLILALAMLVTAGSAAVTSHAEEAAGGDTIFSSYKGDNNGGVDEYSVPAPYEMGTAVSYYSNGRSDDTPKPSVAFDAESLRNIYKGETLAFLLDVTFGGYDYEWTYTIAMNTDTGEYVYWNETTHDTYGLKNDHIVGDPGEHIYVLPSVDTDGEFSTNLAPGHYRIYSCVFGQNAVQQADGTYILVGNPDYVSENWTTMDFDLLPETHSEKIVMYRLYNESNREHFYTADAYERSVLIQRGWNNEGVGWYAPNHSHTPVYRLLNPFTSDHHYTMDLNETTTLISQGWKFEGVGWYSDDQKRVPLYRQFSPVLQTGTHNYTTSAYERDVICDGISWIDEGTAWYAVSGGHPAE